MVDITPQSTYSPHLNMLSYHCILTAFVLALTLSLSPVNGHPGELEPILTARQLERRQVATNKRHAAARNCDSAIVAFEAQRRAKRSLLKRNASVKMAATSTLLSASGTVSANVPTYTALQNVRATTYCSCRLLTFLTEHLCTYT